MALAITALSSTSTADHDGDQTHTSSSFTPTAGARLFAAGVCQNANHSTSQSWSCSGGGLSWSQVAVSAQTGTGNQGFRVALFEATVGGSPSSMTVTLDPFTSTQIGYQSQYVFEVTGTNIAHNQAAVTSISAGDPFTSGTLGSSATTGNLSIALLGRGNETSSPTTPASWTALTVQTQQYTSVNVYHRSDFTSTSVTWTATGTGVAAAASILIELEELPTGTTAPATILTPATVPAATATSTGNDRPLYVQGIAATFSASRSPTVTFAGGVQTGDVVYFYCSTSVTPQAITTPTGWVNVLGANTTVDSDVHMACGVYHIVTSGENGQTAFTATNLFNANATGNVLAAVFRSVDLTTPVDNAGSTSNVNAVTPFVLAAITGTGSALDANSLVVSGVSKDATGTYTTPGTHTMRLTSNSTCGTWLGTHNTVTTANTNVAAVNITPSASDEYVSISVAFKVAGAGATDATATPAVIARSFNVLGAIPKAGTTTAPAVIARTVTTPTVTTTAGLGASTTPAVIARTVTTPNPATTAGSTRAPAVIARTVTIPAASASSGVADTYDLYLGATQITAVYLGATPIDPADLHIGAS